jgi:hypothetical protein
MYLRVSDQGQEHVAHIKNEFDQLAYNSLLKVPAGKRDFTFQTVRDFLKII